MPHLRSVFALIVTLSLLLISVKTPARAQSIAPSPMTRTLDCDRNSVDQLKSNDHLTLSSSLRCFIAKPTLAAEPALRARFANVKEQDLKEMAAIALVRLGVKDDSYWLYLREHAEQAIRSGSPPPAKPEETDEQMIQRLAAAWASAYNVSRNDASTAVTLDNPVSVALLFLTRDPRAIPVLRDGLRSPNPFIRIQAAQWLAQTQDRESVLLLIDALVRERPDLKPLMAQGLAHSYDRRADGMAAQYLSKDTLDHIHRRRDEECKQLGCAPGDREQSPSTADAAAAAAQH